MDQVFEFSLPTDEFRTIPVPYSGGEVEKLKLSHCFVKVSSLPDGLRNWMSVNPRVPKFGKKDKLTGIVARSIVRTLLEEPEKFAIKNQGIYLIVNHAEYKKESGGQGIVTICLSNTSCHGLVNGGHTFRAIREVAEDPDCPEPWDAYVRLHILEAGYAEPAVIADMAEGLNRSLQVDNPSLENLRGTFDKIKESLHSKRGADQIAYRQGDSGEIDVQQVLTYMGLLNLDKFPDRKSHPYTLFGQQKLVLEAFIEDSQREDSSFEVILPKLHEILVLIDKIQQLSAPKLGQLKISSAKTGARVGSKKHKDKPAHFAGGKIGGNVPLGYIYPMLAAFRANISYKAWTEKRQLEWLTDPFQLLEKTVEEMSLIIKQEHQDNKGKPAEVGRKEAAYRGCYTVLTLELAQRNLLEPMHG